jgi:hypothetical protein
MGWIKRNLLFVIVVVAAVGLLGGAGFYIYKGYARNADDFDKLNGIYTSLKDYQSQSPAPGNDKVDNAKIARQQEREIRAWVESAAKWFQPIPPIPNVPNVTSEAFARALSSTVDRLQGMARESGVALPEQYFFSFKAQSRELNVASPAPLSLQLGEVERIAEILFSAKINALDGIQRTRASEDDATGPQVDYIDERAVTNDLAVLAPYVITFRCFTPELSRVIAAFATSSNAFFIKAINIQPAGSSAASPNAAAPGMIPSQPAGVPMPYPTGVTPSANPPVADKNALQTVLKEQMLRVSLEVEFAKLRPKR